MTAALPRYRIESFIGAGGTGQVYRAWDSKLDRPVAFKVLRTVDTSALQKAILEARAQARVAHPNICQVFDAGLQDGKAYVASQLIDGPTLAEIDDLTPHDAVRIVRDVARAVEKAHQEGLVHRDLKPHNVLLDGVDNRTPLVVDFGIASHTRDDDAPQPASSGTPAYMAPEQVRGGPDAASNAVDIYALGGVLHELLTGTPPFQASSEVELLKRVLGEDPPRIEALVPSLPADLGAIVFRCLEKVPARRYATAGALADDLDRWLEGRAVETFPAGFRYRSRLWLRRHRTSAAAAVVVLLILTISAIQAVHQASRSRTQARLARNLGIEAEQIGARMQLAYLAPSDDLQAIRRQVAQRMHDLELRVHSLGALATGPGQTALGYASLRLGNLEASTQHFEAAWSSGYERSEVALGLAETMARRYAEAQRTLWYLSSTVRSVRQNQLRDELLRPALQKIRFVLNSNRDSDVLQDPYVATLTAFLEDRFEDVPALAKTGLETEPFRYENLLLTGYAAQSRAIIVHLDGNPDEARGHLEDARRAFVAAAEIGRSDPRVFQAICQADEALVSDALRQSLDNPDPPSRACDRAIALDPNDAGPHRARASLFQRLAIAKARRGDDPSSALAEAQAHLERALEQQPKDSNGHFLMATQRLIQSDTRSWHDAGTRSELTTQALSHARRGVELDPDSVWAPFLLGQTLYRAATTTASTGEDPTALVDEARNHFERAIELAPRVGRTYSAYGSLLDWFSSVQAEALGQDPKPAKERAKELLRQAASLEPRNAVPLNHLALAYVTMADYLWRVGEDPHPEILAGDQILAEALELRPDSVTALSNRSELWLIGIEASLARSDGEDPIENSTVDALESAYSRHRQAHDQAMELDPDEFGCSLAKSDWYRARIDRRRGQPAISTLDRGLDQTSEMLARFPDSFYCRRDRARLLLEKARVTSDRPSQGTPQDADQFFADSSPWHEGSTLVAALLEEDATSYELWDLRGGYELLAAERSVDADRRSHAELASAAFRKSLELFPRRVRIQKWLRASEILVVSSEPKPLPSLASASPQRSPSGQGN